MSATGRKLRHYISRLARHLSTGLGLWFGLLLATVVATLLATRNPSIEGVEIGPAEIGKPARRAVVAPRTVHLKDVATLERRKRAAERNAALVYVFDADVGQGREAVVREAFSKMRRVLDAGKRRIDAEIERLKNAARAAGARPKTEVAVGSVPPPPPRAAAVPEREADLVEHAARRAVGGPDGAFADVPSVRALRTKYAEDLAEARTGVQRTLRLEDDEYESLVRLRFGIDTENRLIRLVGFAFKFLIPDDPVRLFRESRNVLVQKGGAAAMALDKATATFGAVVDTLQVRSRIQSEATKILTDLDPAARAALVSIAHGLITPNLTFSELLTRDRQIRALREIDGTPPIVRVTRGQIILRVGETVTAENVDLLQRLHQEEIASSDFAAHLGNFVLLALLVLAVVGSHRAQFLRAAVEPRDIMLLVAMVLLVLAATRFALGVSDIFWQRYHEVPLVAFYYMIPVPAGAMVVRLLTTARLALVFSVLIAFAVGLLFQFNFFFSAYVFVGSLAGSALAAQAKNRVALLRAGFVTGLIAAGLTVAFSLLASSAPPELMADALPEGGSILNAGALASLGAGLLSGVLASFVVAAVVPLAEAGFGYTTDVKLLELANLNHPLLKTLIIEAPGTYHHSMVVGNLVEAAAEAIGARSLLGRVGCYYHDLGKIKNPHYFAENQVRGENPHDRLTPSMSGLIIKAHVKDGAEMARENGIAEPIVDFIEQHHGTTLISYFFNKAVEQADAKGDGERIQEVDYRYPGPKPQTRETGIAMLADSIEAAARTIDDPTPARLQGLVQKIINMKFTDGQLDECDLTLRDLHEIAKAFLRVLSGVYHVRPKYQVPATKEASATLRAISGGDGERDRERRPEHYGGEDLRRLGMP
ncbi:MAG: HDIG domain-containing protein [Deltaproteobacteria bacterium]|nr:HDIG domain-containing protein [Deltaproteobacteria bacterium]